MGRYSGKPGMWRGALLGSVSLVAMASASDAQSRLPGTEYRQRALRCRQSFRRVARERRPVSTRIVNINAGAGITGGASFGAFSNGSLTIHHNDPAGITNTGSAGIEFTMPAGGTGAINYTGSADVTGAGAGFLVFSDGRISITQTAGTITGTTASGFGIFIPAPLAVFPDRSININTVGAQIVGPGGGILIQTEGAQSDVTIATGAITGGISVTMGQLTSAGRNLSVTTNGNVVGGIGLRTAGTGTVDVTTNAPVTGGISLRAGNAANTSAFTVNLNQSVAGDVSLQNSGTGTTTVRTGNITGGILTVNGGGANSSLVVDGNITRTGIADERFGSSLAEVNFGRGGTNTATFNGPV